MTLALPFEKPGLQVNVRNVTLNLYSFGQGRPVVFDAGLGCWSYTWALVLGEIAESARVILIDRVGYGFSGPVAGPRTTEIIGEEMRAALMAIDVAPPYTLVGHSFGGAICRWFARTYPDETSGLALIDSGAYEYMQQSEMFKDYLEKCRRSIAGESALDPSKLSPSLASRFAPSLVSFLEERIGSRDVLTAIVSEGAHIYKENVTQMRELPPMRSDLPLRLVSATNRFGVLPPEQRPPQAEMEEREREWLKLQELLASTSTRSKLTFVDSGHFVQYQRPDVVIAAIQDLLSVN